MGVDKPTRRFSDIVADGCHAVGMGVKRMFVASNQVVVRPSKTADLWEQVPALTRRPVTAAAGAPAPAVPTQLRDYTAATVRYTQPAPRARMRNWYEQDTGAIDVAKLGGRLRAGEPWREALGNVPDGLRHTVKWRFNGEDMVRGRFRGHVATSGLCAAAVMCAHDAHEHPNHAHQLYSLLSTYPDRIIAEWVTNFKLHGIVNQQMLLAVLPRLASLAVPRSPRRGEVLRAATLLVATYLRKDENAQRYLRHWTLTSDLTTAASNALPHVQKAFSEAMAECEIANTAIAAARDAAVNADTARMFATANPTDRNAATLSTEAMRAAQAADIQARAAEAGARTGVAAALAPLQAHLDALMDNSTMLRSVYETFEGVLNNPDLNDFERATAMAMITAGMELYGKQKIGKYQRHGERLSLLFQLVGAASGAVPFGGGSPIAALVAIADSLVKHRYEEKKDAITASMDNVLGRIEADPQWEENDPLLNRFHADFNVARKLVATDVSTNRNPRHGTGE